LHFSPINSTQRGNMHSRCFDIMRGDVNFAFHFILKLSVELGYIFFEVINSVNV
jgi:hypothetical protein